mmetsp:Transcript_35604/g.94711  ORF Transcript_35604/g.94711 Transcript_35604/m.94711 type:complete len:115 (-) Transcript_35604:239-583(-)
MRRAHSSHCWTESDAAEPELERVGTATLAYSEDAKVSLHLHLMKRTDPSQVEPSPRCWRCGLGLAQQEESQRKSSAHLYHSSFAGPPLANPFSEEGAESAPPHERLRTTAPVPV